MKSIIILLLAITGTVQASGYTYSQKVLSESEYEKRKVYTELIDKAEEQNDLNTFRKVFEQISTEYAKPEDAMEYMRLTVKIQSRIANIFREEGYEEIKYQTERAIERIESSVQNGYIPAELLPLYWELQESNIYATYPNESYDYWIAIPESPLDNYWVARRKNISEYLTKVLGHVEEGLDSRWVDGHIPKALFPEIPDNGLSIDVYVSGMYLPDYIKDPELKKNYIESLRTQYINELWWGGQRDLRLLYKNLLRKMKIRIGHMYSQKPDNVDELKQILAENKISPEASKRILSAVAVARGEPVPEQEIPEVKPEPAPKVEPIADEEQTEPESPEDRTPIYIALGVILLLALIYGILRTRKR